MNFARHFSRKGVFRVGGAIVFGVVLVSIAFFAGKTAPENAAAQAPAAVVARGDLRTVQEAKDTDNDGLPDWEEALRGTNPHLHTTLDESVTPPETEGDAYAPPVTLTGRFAERFFESVVRKGVAGGLTPEETDEIVERSLGTLKAETKDRLYSQADIRISNSSDLTALREYGNRLGEISLANKAKETNGDKFAILKRAAEENNPAVLAELDPIVATYTGLVSDLLVLETPSSIASRHLDFINALSMVRSDIVAMQAAFEDPLAVLMHIKRYSDDARGVALALDHIRTALTESGVAYASGESGGILFRFRP